MKQADVKVGGIYLTKVGGLLTKVLVQGYRVGEDRKPARYRLTRMDNGRPLPKFRTAAALRPLLPTDAVAS